MELSQSSSRDESFCPLKSKLIDAVEKYPILFDTRHMDHRNRIKTENAWLRVSGEIGQDVTYCKDKWRNLRDTKRKKMKPLPSGSRAKKEWIYSERLEFLRPFLEIKETISNIPRVKYAKASCEGPCIETVYGVSLENEIDDPFNTCEVESVDPDRLLQMTDEQMIEANTPANPIFESEEALKDTPLYARSNPTYRGRKRKNSNGDIIANCVESLMNRKAEGYVECRAKALINMMKQRGLTLEQQTLLFNEFDVMVLAV